MVVTLMFVIVLFQLLFLFTCRNTVALWWHQPTWYLLSWSSVALWYAGKCHHYSRDQWPCSFRSVSLLPTLGVWCQHSDVNCKPFMISCSRLGFKSVAVRKIWCTVLWVCIWVFSISACDPGVLCKCRLACTDPTSVPDMALQSFVSLLVIRYMKNTTDKFDSIETFRNMHLKCSIIMFGLLGYFEICLEWTGIWFMLEVFVLSFCKVFVRM